MVGAQIQYEVEQFLYAEAELLDNHHYTRWVELFAADVRYWLPTRQTLTHRERHLEISGDDGNAFIDDDLRYLRGRVRRLGSGISWSEEPPSRTRRLITNIRVRPGAKDGELDVTSNFYVYRSRLERHEDWFVGERFDRLRRCDSPAPFQYVIASRKIVLDQTTLLAPSISFLL